VLRYILLFQGAKPQAETCDDREFVWGKRKKRQSVELTRASAASPSPIPCAKPAPRDDRAHTRRNPSTTTTTAITIFPRLTAYFAREFTRFLTPILAASTRLRAVAARRFTASCAASQPDLRPRASLPACQKPARLASAFPRRKFGFRFPHVTITPNVLHPRIQCTACTSTETQHKAASARNQRR
jgi:hypothetical protein